MASKLDAFLAVVPANSSAPSPPKSAPASLALPQFEIKVAPENIGILAPTTPKSPLKHQRCSTFQQNSNFGLDLAPDNSSSNRMQVKSEDDRGLTQPSPLKSFMAAQAAAAKFKSYQEKQCLSLPALVRIGSGTELDAKSEAEPMRMASIQGSHHRRVSTDRTSFNRYLRQQEDVDIGQEAIEHFANVPVITATLAVSDELESELGTDDNVNKELTNAGIPELTLDEITALFRLGGTISVSCALEIVRKATNLMSLEQNVIAIRAPYTLVGDLHGQYQDLMQLFHVHGCPAVDNPFLFLGDYVDRGISSCEIILLLLAYKVAYPESVHLLRGNHECRSLSTFYGFRAECLKKYGPVVYNRMIKCFESMPLAARLETSHGTFLAVHGGLSPDISFVDDINDQVNRFMEPEPYGALCDLLWSDPARCKAQEQEWVPNGTRGCSYTFNEQVCCDFLKRNNLLAIIRAHELEEDGFKEHFCQDADQTHEETDENLSLPAVVTVFSAPEYCNTNHNVGATLKIPWEKQNGRLLEYQQHKRSHNAEFEFTRISEDEAVKTFLKDNLPFLPIDFYELVKICRHLRLTLERVASITSQETKPIPKQSLVSSLCTSGTLENKAMKKNLNLYVTPFALTDEMEIKNDVLSATDSNEDNREKLQDWELVDETENFEARTKKSKKNGKKVKLHKNLKDKATERQNKQKERKKWDTSRMVSGWKFCPGFVRFYDRYFARDSLKKNKPEIFSTPSRLGMRVSWNKALFRRSVSTGETADDSATHDTNASDRVRRKTMTDWMAIPSLGEVVQFTSSVQGHNLMQANGVNIFTNTQWQALKLYFSILDLDGGGVLAEESFVVLLAEQDSDAYATEDELSLLLEVMDCNADSLITEQDFLLFAFRAMLRWKKGLHNLD
ncbi:protein phosphatase [Plasmopara halstedii]|uniref:Serine/threonine-protein phosphatase n=1 Tax=Plasmopara halstedii TaxID=4781 RepID=A0A0P1AL03_PLAHL|nr:protein phosphatase [Plasmopara halstedii]CEG41820.1 protein phosphatase [Plasmopara halstedii]|eukprot:XP_024578189.1 protein phosphatase [Plasmopara halstedii]